MTLERCDLLTPMDDQRAIATELIAEAARGRHDHRGEEHAGRKYLVTTIVIPIKERRRSSSSSSRALVPRGAQA